jgi:glutathionylspermidine synthase
MDAPISDYRLARQEFFVRHGARWPGTLADAFDILAPERLTRAETCEILLAAAGLARIYELAARLLHRLPDRALLEMGVPTHLLPTARCTIPGMPDCVIGRFDLARTERGYKLLEFNADVPGLLVEAFPINAQICLDLGKDDPNEYLEQVLIQALAGAVQAGLEYVGKPGGDQANVVVTCEGHCRRDRDLANYLCGLIKAFPVQYAPIRSLGIDAQGIYDPSGKRIDVLYRVFPLRFIRNELFRQQGTPLNPEMGGMVLQLVEQRRLAIINPPFSFLLESKALQAVIWNLFELGLYFAEKERRLIEQYMLPTYLDPLPGTAAQVMKPVYGAEGDTVKVITADDRVICQAPCTSYSDQIMVYQKHVELPALDMMTEYGQRTLQVVTSCFLISGKPAGICMRAGGPITDDSAWVLPVCILG